MTEFKTQDYAKPTIKTSQIPAEGIEIVYRGMRSVETKFTKEMYVVDCLKDGREHDMIFNSVKLAKIFSENDAVLQGATLRIIPEGQGPQREYTVRVVPGVVQGTL